MSKADGPRANAPIKPILDARRIGAAGDKTKKASAQ